ncbi:MAG: hypothetical protein R3A48_08515 [Polyangiales bacterium]
MRWAATLLVLAGCSSPTVNPPGADAALEIDAVDVVTAPDLVAPPLDASSLDAPRADAVRMDAPEAPREDAPVVADDVVIDPGMCGAAVRTCFCNCGANPVCQQGCINRDQDCGFCVYLAATRCCPAQSEVLDRCIDASMCTDDPCIRTRCAGEVAAFEGCFASSQMTEPACQAEMRTCLGSDFPQVRCVVRR